MVTTTEATHEPVTTSVPVEEPRRRLTREDLRNKNGEIRRRCYTINENGTKTVVTMAHMSRLLNPCRPHTPSLGLAVQMADALTDILGWHVTLDHLVEYLRDVLGKPLSWPKEEQ